MWSTPEAKENQWGDYNLVNEKTRMVPYVMSMANQPPKHTRTAALPMFAPPRRAPITPKTTSAKDDANTMDKSRFV